MKKTTAFIIFLMATILWVLFMFSVVACFGAENKPTSQMTSKDIKERDLLFKSCIASGKSRAECYYLYY